MSINVGDTLEGEMITFPVGDGATFLGKYNSNPVILCFICDVVPIDNSVKLISALYGLSNRQKWIDNNIGICVVCDDAFVQNQLQGLVDQLGEDGFTNLPLASLSSITSFLNNNNGLNYLRCNFGFVQDNALFGDALYNIESPPIWYTIDLKNSICKVMGVNKPGWEQSRPCSTIGDREQLIIEKAYRDFWPKPLALELVMDISDSMNCPAGSGTASKYEVLKSHVISVVSVMKSFMNPEDRLGLTFFNNKVIQKLGADQMWSNNGDIPSDPFNPENTDDPITAGGCTALGAGLACGLYVLKNFTFLNPEIIKAIILITDGMQNIHPKLYYNQSNGQYTIENHDGEGWCCQSTIWDDLSQSIRTLIHENPPYVDIRTIVNKIHTLGIGIIDTYADLISGLATATGGTYQSTETMAEDLDLLLTLMLADLLKDRCPTVVHHHNAIFNNGAGGVIEQFYINKSIWKISVLLSWPQAIPSSLTFWLRDPGGNLIDLSSAMKLFPNYCIATLLLPIGDYGQNSHVGQWTMVIKGESDTTEVPYHAMVVADDRGTSFSCIIDRTISLADAHPVISIGLSIQGDPVSINQEVKLTTVKRESSPAKLMAEYSNWSVPNNPPADHTELQFTQKWLDMSKNIEFLEQHKPQKKKPLILSNNVLANAGKAGKTIIPAPLRGPGLHSFRVDILHDKGEEGFIQRVGMASLHVMPGPADRKNSTINLEPPVLRVTPCDVNKNLFGPGCGKDFLFRVDGEQVLPIVRDLLNGSYDLQLNGSMLNTKTGPRPGKHTIELLFKEVTLWDSESPLSKPPVHRKTSRPG